MNDFSRELARLLGETKGRTVSTRMGDGLSHLSGGAIPSDRAKDIVHMAMVLGVAAYLLPVAPRQYTLPIGAFAAIVAWQAGRLLS